MTKYPTTAEVRAALAPPDPKIYEHFSLFMAGCKFRPQLSKVIPNMDGKPETLRLADFICWLNDACGWDPVKVVASGGNSSNWCDGANRVILLSSDDPLVGLHELWHLWNGTDELGACAWSSSLVLKWHKDNLKPGEPFPLKWSGHKLVRR